MKIFRNFIYVITNYQFNLIDKILYVGYLFVFCLGIFLTVSSYLKYRDYSEIGFGLLLLCLFFGKKFFTKYVMPYNQTLGQNYAQQEYQGVANVYSQSTSTIQHIMWLEVFMNFIHKFALIIIILTFGVLYKLGMQLNTILVVLAIEFVIYVIIAIRIGFKK